MSEMWLSYFDGILLMLVFLLAVLDILTHNLVRFRECKCGVGSVLIAIVATVGYLWVAVRVVQYIWGAY